MADQYLYPHTETHTHDCELKTINTTSKRPVYKGHHNPTIYTLEYTDPDIYISNYNTTRVYKAKTISTVNRFMFFLFFFFERNQNRDDTAFENCSCLATWYTCLDSKLKKKEGRTKNEKKTFFILVNVKS